MLGKKTILAAAAIVAGLLMPAQAMAQYEAYTRVDLNLRVGPDTTYGIIDVIPYGEPVNVLGCLEQFAWCDIEWYGLRGWVAAEYLVQPDNTMVYLPQFAPRIGLPIIAFSFDTYHDRHYRDRPWYRERRGSWRGREYRRGDRPRARQEVRERIREEQRRENRQERARTERRQENRQERARTEQRQENRQERARTEQRQENRQERARTEQRQEKRKERARTEQRQENRKERAQTEQRQENRKQRAQTEKQAEKKQKKQEDAPREGQRKQRPQVQVE